MIRITTILSKSTSLSRLSITPLDERGRIQTQRSLADSTRFPSSLCFSIRRLPAWCDRILFRPSTTDPIELQSYTSHPEISFSDHQPVSVRILPFILFSPSLPPSSPTLPSQLRPRLELTGSSLFFLGSSSCIGQLRRLSPKNRSSTMETSPRASWTRSRQDGERCRSYLGGFGERD